MSRRKAPAQPKGLPAAEPPLRVLVVSPSRAERERLSGALAALRAQVRPVSGAVAAAQALEDLFFDAVLVSTSIPRCLPLAARMSEADDAMAVLLVGRPTVELAVDALRAGAADLLDDQTPDEQIAVRVIAAAKRRRGARERQARLRRLRRVCRRLNTERHEVTRQVGSLCSDLVEAYQALADQMTTVTLASEFNGLIRQELDVEGLLRTALEFILAHAGPTNAAVFLPTTSGDFSLGAYVNYDCPKESADLLLEQLSGIIAPRVQDEDGVLSMASEDELRAFLGEDAHWLSDSGVLTFACRHDGECLAVVTLFRDRRTPFAAPLTPGMETISRLFGRQLARVIHVHHRHLPKDKWGGFDDDGAGDGADDIDLAA